jgi:hypothetical protein
MQVLSYGPIRRSSGGVGLNLKETAYIHETHELRTLQVLNRVWRFPGPLPPHHRVRTIAADRVAGGLSYVTASMRLAPSVRRLLSQGLDGR